MVGGAKPVRLGEMAALLWSVESFNTSLNCPYCVDRNCADRNYTILGKRI